LLGSRGSVRAATRVAGLTLFVACLDPTEIMVTITTDVPCGSARGTAIAVGNPGDDTSPVVAGTRSCDEGQIGSLAVLPSGNGDIVGIRVTMGVDTDVDACAPPMFEGCIVARRALHFTSNHRLDLPITLESDCENVHCDPNSTCANSVCVEAGVECDDAGSCGVETPDASPDAPSIDLTCGAPPTLVAADAPAGRPYIALTTGGYAIAWSTTADGGSEVVAETIAPNGISPVTPIIELGGNGTVGPFATDGVNYALLTLGNSGVQITYAPADGSAVTTAVASSTFSYLPYAGLAYASTQLMYLAVDNANDAYVLESYSVTAKAVAAQPLVTTFTPDASFSLDYENGSLYVGSFGSDLCALSVYTTLTATPTTDFPLGMGVGCSAVLAAGNTDGLQPGAEVGAIYEASGVLVFQEFAATTVAARGNATVGSVDADSFVVMNDGTTSFRVIHSKGGAVAFHVFDGAANELDSESLVTLPSPGRQWDAVSDGPTETSYGFVYWSASPTPGFWFQRYCQ
jgi:hypothetical protein